MSEKNTNFSRFDKKMMKRCLTIAKKASGFTAPNPLVGAVIVKDGKVISEGYHHYFGGPHAEVNAIANAQEDLKGAHIYVNLEPCSYYGKTPACSLALIQHQFAKVFIATLDPNPLIAGNGVQALRNAGMQVKTGLLEAEALKFNERFFHFITHKTPFIALKIAASLDGKIATESGESQWITNEKSRAFVHELRQDYSAILVGIGTVLKDNPALTVRKPGKTKNPVRVIIDSQLRTPPSSKILDNHAKVIIAISESIEEKKIEEFIKEEHISLWKCPAKNGQINLQYVFSKLGKEGIDSVLVEGGAEINASILQHHLTHKIYAFIAPIIIGGQNSKSAFGSKGFQKLSEAPKLKNITYKNLDTDLLMEGYF